jgi:hypothetical protein
MAGLYLDETWRETEFQKWKAAGEVNDDYVYNGYLAPYPGIHSVVALVINYDVADDERNNEDAGGHRSPNGENCEKVWPYLVNELCRVPDPQLGKPPLWYDQKPVISTLAAIYLGNPSLVTEAMLKCPAYIKPKFNRLLETWGRPEAREGLELIKGALFMDLMDPPNCW